MEFRVYMEFRVKGVGLRVERRLWIRVPGCGFRVSGL